MHKVDRAVPARCFLQRKRDQDIAIHLPLAAVPQ
jgi:hypothetical protein